MSQNVLNRAAVPAPIQDVHSLRRAVGLTLTVSLAACTMLYPAESKAGVLDWISTGWQNKAQAMTLQSPKSAATVQLPQAALNIDPNPAKGGGDVTVVDGEALVPEEGPAGTMADIEKSKNQSISIYVVREGDTLSGIAEMFDVSVNTIRWANDIPPSGTIRIGQTLTILPITSVKHVVKKGDTLASIAKQYKADEEEIVNYNRLESSLAVGSEIIIPNGEIAAPAAPKAVASSGGSTAVASGYYAHPVPGARRTQGIHGYNGVDLAAPIGTAVRAAAAGEVIIARQGGYNGGYGSYVVVRHDNGTQTLYAHLSSVSVGIGQTVGKGETIGGVGNSGRSTGAHLHFEIRGARNPF